MDQDVPLCFLYYLFTFGQHLTFRETVANNCRSAVPVCIIPKEN